MKRVALCRKCLRRLGVTFERTPIPDLYCTDCEQAEMKEREAMEAEAERYRAAVRSA